jgi:hypothetical protein
MAYKRLVFLFSSNELSGNLVWHLLNLKLHRLSHSFEPLLVPFCFKTFVRVEVWNQSETNPVFGNSAAQRGKVQIQLLQPDEI